MRWEYRTETISRRIGKMEPTPWNGQVDLNFLGAQGWELVSAIPQSSQAGRDHAGFTTDITFIFKRPMLDAQ